ncbi:MAG: 16S rRNA (cytosine(967)-C(5))-methyltransferase RsmB [Planctomycetota bacterium]|jgi:16S rRNA (cytosine967-C5)-methyltransferase
MSTKKIKNARTLAAFVLHQFNPQKDYASDILNKYITELEPTSEKQRATDLVYGCLRNLSTIDHCISTLAQRPIERIQPKILNILRPAVYELLYCSSSPEYAIVNESVEITKTSGGKKQTSFVNAVLRQITGHIANRNTEIKNTNLQKIIPQNLSTGCLFDAEILPDLQTQPLEYFSLAFSLPLWLIKNWLDEYGVDKTSQICNASNRRAQVWIRPNILKISKEELAEKLQKNGVECKSSPANSMLQLKSPSSITNLPGFREGEFTIQDLTAAQPVFLLDARAGQRILDLCAAPGTKTTQLAELCSDKSEIIATDISSERLEMVGENIKRLGFRSVVTIPYEKVEKESHDLGLFDKILLDVPCSNTGVLSKRIEVRFRITQAAIKKITKIQLKLLELAVKLLKSNGQICYSTCSIQPEENNKVVEQFLDTNKDFEVKTEKLTLPSAEKPDHDGGYVAIIKKT